MKRGGLALVLLVEAFVNASGDCFAMKPPDRANEKCSGYTDCASCTLSRYRYTPGLERHLEPICHWQEEEGSEIVRFDYDCPLGPVPYPDTAPAILEHWFSAFRKEGYLRNVTLLDFSLPGTHDSLSYDLSLVVSKEGLDTYGWLANILHALSGRHLIKGELENFFRMQAKTQQLTLLQQLDNGIRFLDIRLMYEGSNWFSIHFMQSKHTIMEYFVQIRNWMEKHPDEIIVLWLSRHGNTHATGENQYPNVPVQVRQELWQRLTALFEGMLFDSTICNISTDSIEHLLNNNCRVVPFVSDYALFTGESIFALDAARIVNSWDTKGGVFSEAAQNQEHCTYFDQIGRRNERARSKGLFTLRGMNSQSNRQQILHSAQRRFLGWAVNFRCKLKGMNATKWCPDTLLDIAQLSSYYNQRALDSARDFPHAFYLDALDYNGTIRTGSQLLNGASHGGKLYRYAYVDTLLSYNLRKVPDLPADCSLCMAFEKRRRFYPVSYWLEIHFGRYTTWPSDCFGVDSRDEGTPTVASSYMSPE